MAVSLFSDVPSSGAPRGHAALAEINITPLIDVMLVLLIIFMVIAPVVTRPLALSLPQAPPPDRQVPDDLQRIRLVALGDGQFRLDDALLARQGLVAALVDHAGDRRDVLLSVSATDEADYQAFTDALAAARESGIGNIAFEQ
jgi:biopolymer transport protein ExbD